MSDPFLEGVALATIVACIGIPVLMLAHWLDATKGRRDRHRQHKRRMAQIRKRYAR